MGNAIVIIDMQNDFFKNENLQKNRNRLVENINELIEYGRRQNYKIIWVRQEFKQDLSDAPKYIREKEVQIVLENTYGSKLVQGLEVDKSDFEVIKKGYSAFYNTELHELLKKHDIEKLIICGVHTHACVRMAVVDAHQRDYDVVLALDCIDSWSSDYHNETIKYLTYRIATGRIATGLKNNEIITLS